MSEQNGKPEARRNSDRKRKGGIVEAMLGSTGSTGSILPVAIIIAQYIPLRGKSTKGRKLFANRTRISASLIFPLPIALPPHRHLIIMLATQTFDSLTNFRLLVSGFEIRSHSLQENASFLSPYAEKQLVQQDVHLMKEFLTSNKL